jgi:hypothetical protein
VAKTDIPSIGTDYVCECALTINSASETSGTFCDLAIGTNGWATFFWFSSGLLLVLGIFLEYGARRVALSGGAIAAGGAYSNMGTA